MGFFAEFSAWLNALLLTYIGDNIARIARRLEPAIVTFGVLYVMVWGYLQLTGQIQEPFVDGREADRDAGRDPGCVAAAVAVQPVIVDTFFNGAGQLWPRRSSVRPTPSPSSTRSSLRATMPRRCYSRRAAFSMATSPIYLAGIAVYLIVGLTAIYTIFLLTLSRIALSVLLALGPLFIALLFFETTKRFFESWIAQLANYALITILTVLVAALMMTLVSAAAEQAAAAGGGIEIAHAVRVCMAAGLDVSRDAPGDADGGGSREWTGVEHLRRGERGACCGGSAAPRAERARFRAVRFGSGHDAMGQPEPQAG